MKDRRKTDDKSTKNGQTHEEQTINAGNMNMFAELKVPLCYKRKEEPEEVMHEHLLPCNTNATESYTKRNANTPNGMQMHQNGNGVKRENGVKRKRNRNFTCAFIDLVSFN